MASLIVQLYDEHLAVASALEAQKQKAQEFFAAFATELRAPHYGDAAKLFAEGMLRRAEEKGLYIAPKEEAK